MSTHGPIVIGEGCIVWEKAVVGGAGSVELGKDVVVESCSVVEGGVLGEACVVEAFAKIGNEASVGKGCRVMSFVKVAEGEVVGEYMILYGKGLRRRDETVRLEDGLVEGIKRRAHGKQIKSFEGLVPSNLAKWA
jgi:dynactin-6